MIHVKFLSPALTGQPVSMTVSQGRVSHSLSIDAFETLRTPPPDDGGADDGQVVTPPSQGGASLVISVRRGQQQLAPEGIAFFAEVGGFDAQKPTDGKVYDPTLHDIHYRWSFGDPGSYDVPVNMLPQWRDRNLGHGPFPAHVFRTPGTYRVTCVATERSSGKTASASIDVTVQDPASAFTSATRIVVSGSGDFTGAPAADAANRVTTFADAMTRAKALKSNGNPIGIFFKSGDTFVCPGQVVVGRSFRNFYVGTWGGTARARIKGLSSGSIFYMAGDLPTSGASISNIDFIGPWDSTTETRVPPEAIAPSGINITGGFCTVSGCSGSGLGSFVVGSVNGSVKTIIVSDCSATNWEDYGAYLENDETSGYTAVLGCRFAQDPDALQGGNGKSRTDLGNRHGALRFHGTRHLYVDAVDLFSRNGWTVVAGKPVDQNPIRDHRSEPLSHGFFSRIMGEGGWGMYSNGEAAPDAGADGDGQGFHMPCNTVLDKAYFLGSARTIMQLGLSSSAFTGRNLVLHRVNTGTDADPCGRAIEIGTGSPGDFHPTTRSEPIRLYNVTVINEMDDVQQARNAQRSTGWQPVVIRPGCYDDGMIQIENLVVHRPNFTGGFVADAPLNSTRLGLTPRYLGYRWKNHTASNLGDKLTMDSSFATTGTPWSLWRPQAGSPAIGSATGRVAHDDLLGKVRPARASRGAAEPA